MNTITSKSQVASFIEIKGENQEEINKVESALKRIKWGRNGNELLNRLNCLSNGDRKLTIEIDDSTSSCNIPFLTNSQLKKYKIDPEDLEGSNHKASEISTRKGFLRNGEGVSNLVKFNPDYFVRVEEDGTHLYTIEKNNSFVMLAHELIHAYRNMKGASYGIVHEDKPDVKESKEERRVMGIDEFKNERISENGIRKDHGIHLRKQHKTEHDWKQIDWMNEMSRRGRGY